MSTQAGSTIEPSRDADFDNLLDALWGAETGEGFQFTRDKIHAHIDRRVETEKAAAVAEAVEAAVAAATAKARVVAFTEAYDAVEKHNYEPMNGIHPEGHIARLLSAATDEVVKVAAAARERVATDAGATTGAKA